MRIRVAFETTYAYERPPRAMVQLLRVTPRDHDGQQVGRWRVQVDADGRLRAGEDAFGNLSHVFYLTRPAARVRILVEGEAEVEDVAGVLRGAAERFPPEVYLRDTPLTEPAAALQALADDARARTGDALGRLHALMHLVAERVRFETGRTGVLTTAADALELGHGVCQDMTHVFVAAARRLGAPARYVSGQLVREDGVTDQDAAHAWAEAHVEGLGWVGFDAANRTCPTDRYLRVAAGPDYLAAAPVRGAHTGGAGERMDVRLSVADAARGATPRGGPSQSQSQSQSST